MSRARKIQQHQTIRNEIKDTARQLMAQEGTAGLSIRAIAREMQMTAPALYHYYPNRDALVTDLIADSFNALADALELARNDQPGSPGAKLMAVLQAYRQWALTHPVDFQLIYGNPIPGYEAPEDVTVPAATRSLLVVVDLLEQGLSRPGQPAWDGYRQAPPAMESHLVVLAQTLPEEYRNLSPLALYLGVVGWPRLHGIIMLELFNHIQPVAGDIDTFFQIQMEDLLNQAGIVVE